LPITLTVGTNTYITLADAETYHGDRLWADSWTSATDDDKSKALIMACRIIDVQPIKGRKQNLLGQTLQFPRYLPEDYSIDPMMVPNLVNGEVPDCVKYAQCEQALWLLQQTEYDRARLKDQVNGIIGGSIGAANEYSNPGFVAESRNRRTLCPDAREFLKPWLLGAVNIR